MGKGILENAGVKVAWALCLLATACQEEAAPKPPEATVSPVCSENGTQPLCAQASGCNWTGAACTTQTSAADTQQPTCASKAQNECTSNCHWDAAVGKCADGAVSAQVAECGTRNINNCSSTPGCTWDLPNNLCKGTALQPDASGVCGQFANNTLGCLQAQNQGCSWNSNTCVSTNPNAASCASKTSVPDCNALAGIGCQWSNFKCVSTMVVNGNPSQGPTVKSTGGNGGNGLLVAGLGILAAVLPILLNKGHSNTPPVTSSIPPNADAAQVVGDVPTGGGVSNAGNASLASQCAQLDETQCKANFVACNWSGKSCTGKQ